MDNIIINYLIGMLQSKTTELGVRDDAAMDLGAYDEPEVLDALIKVALDENEHETVLWSCGESIKCIWLRGSEYSSKLINADLLDDFAPAARQECNIIFSMGE